MKPQKLRKGDKIAIVSLSRGILGMPFCKHQLDIAIKRLKEFGLVPVIMPNALKDMKYIEEHPEARASDLKEAFMDNVKDFNLPQFVRNAVGDGKIRSELNGKKSEIYSKIASGIKNNSRFRSELRKNVASAAGKIVQEVTKQITFDLNR